MKRKASQLVVLQPSGFSLMELMIVMALIVIVAGLAAPNLIERMKGNRVYSAADQVREVLSEARTYAIDSGIDYQFRYEPQGQFFVILPTEQEPSTSNSVSTGSETSEYMRLSGQLDEDLLIQPMPDESDTIERLEPLWFGGLPDAGTLATKSWSSPIYFRFDGSATDRRFRVTDPDGRTSELSVRGLTGAVRMTPVYQEAQQ
ncbi:MAG: prepilin-type N-terminal cleavage/methylation domain-containing protein [Planctomycetaceae bacterium]|nr:prepilin-type N-terminal cleavage/methylation domain-containing protein [Planctomycetaceae bacterium]